MTNREHPTLEELMDYVHGELKEHDDAAVHAHLAGCSPCSEAYEQEARLGELLRDHARLEERELPPSVVDGIFDALAEQSSASPTVWRRLSAALRPAIALPVAAAIVLAVYFGFVATHGTARAQSIDASYYLEDHAEFATTVPFSDESAAPAMLTSDDAASGEQMVDESH